MKAWVLHGVSDIVYEDVNIPVIKRDEVLVQVKAAGICGSDIPRIYRDGAHNMPLIPGHEFSGIVARVGTKEHSEWKNKRVGIFPLIPCGECIACRAGRHEMCRNYSYLGSRIDGGFAEYVAVPAGNLIELPDNVSYEQAAMLEPMAVAVHAMRRMSINDNDAVAVCGLGTIGQLLVMFLKEYGIRNILVVGNKAYQKEVILELGIDESNYCDANSSNVKDWIYEHTDGIGTDIFFECVGNNDTVSLAVDVAAPGGKLCLVGNPHSDMLLEKNIYWKILRNQLEMTGTWNSSFYTSGVDGLTDWEYALKLLENGKISPERVISHRFELNDLEEGFLIMRDKSEEYLKVMAILR